jgi:Trk-type K+ transport system membrane component
MTALTTVGFNTVPIGRFTLGVLLVVIFLMYVGASPSGTGGGMKSTTLTALIAIMWSRIRNNKQVTPRRGNGKGNDALPRDAHGPSGFRRDSIGRE